MDIDFNLEIFIHAIEKNVENDLWEMWKLQFPNMDKETFISFEDYKNKLKNKQYTKKSYEAIEKEMEQVERAFKERR